MKPISQVREEGLCVLTDSLGVVDTIRFMQQFETGRGDYTAARRRILGNPSVNEVLKQIKLQRGKRGSTRLLPRGR